MLLRANTHGHDEVVENYVVYAFLRECAMIVLQSSTLIAHCKVSWIVIKLIIMRIRGCIQGLDRIGGIISF